MLFYISLIFSLHKSYFDFLHECVRYDFEARLVSTADIISIFTKLGLKH